jgi:molecular chaperone DnaK (HSP70)
MTEDSQNISINKNLINLSVDFGTCNTVIGYKSDDKILHVLDEVSGDVLIPSIILFIKEEIDPNLSSSQLEINKHYLIGNAAKDAYNFKKDHNSYFYQFKRFLGITSKSIHTQKEFIDKFQVKYDTDEDTIYFYIPTRQDDKYIKINIIELIKLYFRGLINLIKSSLNIVGELQIILTCPAYFHDLQRSQLKKAAENAGFKIFKMYNEPTSAAIYYIRKYDELTLENNKFIVYDLGGGTIDTTVVEYHIEDKTCEIIDIDGNNSLGGIDIDNLLINDIYYKYSIDKSDLKWTNQIRKCAEDIKIRLSYTKNYEMTLENVPIKKGDNKNYVDILKISYSQQMFNNIINNLIDKMIDSILNMYKKHLTKNIIFIGGPTQIPLLQNKVNSILNIDSNKIILNQNALLYKTIVADGACLLYELLNSQDEFCLLDIVPMNIGISSPEGKMTIMINSHSKIPVTVEKVFSTSHDCQRTIDIEVFEGTSEFIKENNYIGSYKIVGIPPLPRGSIIIKLLFKISYNGILDVSISGFKNPSDNSAKSFDFKLTEKIKLIPNIIAKELLRKILGDKK